MVFCLLNHVFIFQIKKKTLTLVKTLSTDSHYQLSEVWFINSYGSQTLQAPDIKSHYLFTLMLGTFQNVHPNLRGSLTLMRLYGFDIFLHTQQAESTGLLMSLCAVYVGVRVCVCVWGCRLGVSEGAACVCAARRSVRLLLCFQFQVISPADHSAIQAKNLKITLTGACVRAGACVCVSGVGGVSIE